MGGWVRDLRFGGRMLAKRPGTSALAIVALSLGIGLTATMFSIVNAAFLRGLPFEEPGRIMYVGPVAVRNPERPGAFNVHDFVDFKREQKSFDDLAGYYTADTDLIADDKIPQRYPGVYLTANALSVMRMAPAMGQAFTERDDAIGAPKVVIISHGIWVSRFHQASDVVGRTVKLNADTATVIGVMPEGFGFPQIGQLWMPLAIDTPAKRSDGISLNAFGRLRHGVTLDSAKTELQSIASRLAAQYPENKDRTATAMPFVRRYLGPQIISTLSTLLAAVFGVLLIACVNVTNLQLARAADRTKEVAVRLALGASRRRLVRQLLVEGLILAAAGSLIGLLLARIGTAWFQDAVSDTGKPFWIDVKIDGGSLLFVMAMTIVAAIASSLVPALRVTNTGLGEVLKDEGRGGTGLRVGRFSRGLIVAQMTLSFTLLLASGLMAKSIAAASSQVFPFRTDVLTGRLDLRGDAYKEDAALRHITERIEARVRQIPGATSVSFSTGVPSDAGSGPIELEGIPLPAKDSGVPPPIAERFTASSSFLKTMGLQTMRGRALKVEDRDSSELVALVSTDFAARYMRGQDPIGHRIRQGTDGKNPWRTIVGTIPTLSTGGRTNNDPVATVIFSLDQTPARNALIFVTGSSSVVTEGDLRRAVADVDPSLVMFDVMTVRARFDERTWPSRVFGTLVVGFGLSALLMASAGLYGVMSFGVRRRTPEIGVRMALGAGRPEILRLVLRQGAWLVGIGVVLGAGLGIGLGSLLEELLFRVRPWDPPVLAGTFVVLSAAGFIACLLPAWRASRVDPLVALRNS